MNNYVVSRWWSHRKGGTAVDRQPQIPSSGFFLFNPSAFSTRLSRKVNSLKTLLLFLPYEEYGMSFLGAAMCHKVVVALEHQASAVLALRLPSHTIISVEQSSPQYNVLVSWW